MELVTGTKGEVKLVFTNVDTNEQRSHKQGNIITSVFDSLLYSNNPTGQYARPIYETETMGVVFLMIQKTYPGIKGFGSINDYTNGYIVPTSVEDKWAYVDGPTPYMECRFRFAPPGSTRTIYGILLGGAPTSSSSASTATARVGGAYAVLTTPCTQGTTEYLDVYYRVYILQTTVTSTPKTAVGSYVTQILSNNAALSINGLINASTDVQVDNDARSFLTCRFNNLYGLSQRVNPAVVSNLSYKYFASRPEFLNYGSTRDTIMSRPATSAQEINPYVVPFYANTSVSHTVSDHIGRYFRSGFLTSVDVFCGSTLTYGIGQFTCFHHTSLYQDYPYKPVQVIHNHNSGAIAPFLDVNFLASSQGSINVQSTSWTDSFSGLLEYHRVQFINTGNVGVARYFIRKCERTSFTGNTYASDHSSSEVIGLAHNIHFGKSSDKIHSGIEPDWLCNAEEFDERRILIHDQLGITLFNCIDNTFVSFDATTTPALNVTSVRQATVTSTGVIFVADSASGLYKIVNALTSPVITKITYATHDTNCYGVTVGYNDRIWAVWLDTLAYSDNAGTSWTPLTFTHSPAVAGESLTANNKWSSTCFLRADRSANTHDLCLLRRIPADTARNARAVFIRPTETVVYDSYDTFQILLDTNGPIAVTSAFRCSYKGGFWAAFDATMTTGKLVRVHFMPSFEKMLQSFGSLKVTCTDASTATSTTPSDTYGAGYDTIAALVFMEETQTYTRRGTAGVVFAYDRYDEPYIVLPTYYGGTVTGTSLPGSRYYTRFGRPIAYASSNNLPYFGWERNYHGNYLTHSGGSLASGDYRNTATVSYRTHTIGQDNQLTYHTTVKDNAALYVPDAMNGHNGPCRSFIWKDYRWNGTLSQWEANYMYPLKDIVGSNDGVRRGFGTESHTFNGFSAVDISLTPIDFSSQAATFVSTVSFGTREPGQITRHAIFCVPGLFSLYYNTNGTKLTFIQHNGRNIAFDHEYAHTPVTNNRYVVTLKTNAAKAISFQNMHIHSLGETYIHYTLYPQTDDITFTRVGGGSTAHAQNRPWIYMSPISQSGNNMSVKFKFTKNLMTYGFVGWKFGADVNVSDFRNTSDATFEPFSTNTFAVRIGAAAAAPVLLRGQGTGTSAQSTTMTVNSAVVTADINGTNTLEVKCQLVSTTWTISLIRNGATTIASTTFTDAGFGASPFSYLFSSETASTTSGIHGSFNDINVVNNATVSDVTPYLSPVYEAKVYAQGSLVATHYVTGVNLTTAGNTLLLGNSIGAGHIINEFDQYTIYSARVRQYAMVATNERYYYLNGTLANTQIWSGEWNATDVTNDNAAPTGVISTANGTIRARYTYDSLSGLETKTTHSGYDTYPNGLQIKFNAGVGSPHFSSGDYYTFGVVDGILKDNAVSCDVTMRTYYRPMTWTFDHVEDSVGSAGTKVTTVPAAVTRNVTEWYVPRQSTQSTFLTYGKGYLSVQRTGLTTGTTAQTTSFQVMSGSLTFKFRPQCEKMLGACGISSALVVGVQNTANTCFISFATANTFATYIGTVAGPTGTYEPADLFEIRRSGSTVTFWKNGTQIHTGTFNSNPVTANININGSHGCFCSLELIYDRNYGMPTLDIGNKLASTGRWNPEFISFDNDTRNWTVTLNGVPVGSLTFNYSNISSALPALATGQVAVIADLGVLLMSASDVGKTLVVNAPFATNT